MLKNRSITTQFTIIFVLSLAILGTAVYFILNQVYYNQLKSQAETVADNVDAFGSWVAQYGRVWVKDNDKSYLGQMTLIHAPVDPGVGEGNVAPDAAQPTAVNFYSKNPALAQREFSEAVEKSASSAKFRLTSDNYMNPVNKPDTFEEHALQKVKNGNLKEYFEVTPGTFRYARTVYHKASCIACHGDAQKAPQDVKVRYGLERGFNFKEGDVAGIISVKVPTRPFFQVALNVISPWQIALIIAAFVISFIFIRMVVVSPIKKLTHAAAEISLGNPADLGIEGLNQKSTNEIHQLAFGVDRLRTSLEMVATRLKAQKKGNGQS